jgi:hypothetical protein
MKTRLILALGAVSAVALSAHGQNFVLNPGFETGDTTDWTFTPATEGSGFDVFFQTWGGGGYEPWVAHSGDYQAGFGAIQGLNDTLSQTLPTTAGADYQISFWLFNPGNSDLTVTWGATTLLHVGLGDVSAQWTKFDFIQPAAGPTTLAFAGQNPPAWIGLDDVSVSQVPEPASCAIAGSLCLIGFAASRRVFRRFRRA